MTEEPPADSLPRICVLMGEVSTDDRGQPNGTEVQALRVGQGLAALGYPVCVVAAAPPREVRTQASLGGLPCSWYVRSRWWPVSETLRACAVVRPLQADVFYVRGRNPMNAVAAWCARKRRGVAVWATNCDEGGGRWKELGRLWRSRKALWRRLALTPPLAARDMVTHWGLKRADVVVNQTAAQQESVRRVWGHQGVIIRTGHPVPEVRRPAPRCFTAVWVGRVSAHKRPEHFLELAKRCADLDAEFVLVGGTGDADYWKSLRTQANAMPQLTLSGQVSPAEADRAIAEASVLVNTSVYEGVSNAMVQAWLHGVPTLVESHDPDGIVEREGVGMLAGDVDGLERLVRRLAQDSGLLDAVSGSARRYGAEAHALDVVARQYEERILAALADRR
jgi:glycosyltransferase involved in cell wall biosynthesis